MSYMSILKKGILIVLIIIASIIAVKLSVFYIPFIVAYVISLLVDPMIKWVNRKTNLTRKVSSMIILATIFLIIISIIVFGVISLISEATNLLSGLNTYLDKIIEMIKEISNKIDFDKFQLSEEVKGIVGDTATNLVSNVTEFIKNTLSSFISSVTSIPRMLIYVVITILATYFITSDKFYILDRMEHHLPKKLVGKIIKFTDDMKYSLGGYLKAQIILIGISFVIVLVGLNIFYFMGMNIEYPVLMALLIGFVDALPILGSGTIMIPWTLISLLNKDYGTASSILGLYILIVVVKQILEPKIVSSKIGIHPFFTLIAMYTGFKLIGILGLLVGPIALIILKSVFSSSIDKGIVKAIIEE